MATGEHRPSTRRRYRLILGALLIWVVVVMAAAGSAAGDSLLGVERLEILWVIGLVLMALTGLIMLIVLNPFQGEWVKPQRERKFGGWILPLVLLALVIWKPDVLPEFDPQDVSDSAPAGLSSAVPSDEAEDAPETVAQLSDLLFLLAAAVVVGTGVFLLRRGQSADDGDLDVESEQAELEADLAVALEELTAELKMGADPRSSVLAAYAVLESVLSEHGSKRARAETPSEHLKRSLRRLRIDAGPLVQLGDLYEIARFSDQPVTIADQQDALRSLEQARAELASLT